ncbi:MAG: hypothetical protein A2287_00685 [Candidatus Melainabacteria bacterium RIFOXYA12_FULL_32_12]|nr:MAG: hypothetical protein A2287_00685 [Candidatus Melainabacteria bacterium RIFOXYA12_FULL_32_12]
MNKRKNYLASFKAKVALEAIKGELTLPELSAKYDVHPTIISKWKQEGIKNFQGIYEGRIKSAANHDKSEKAELYKKIGELQVQLDFLKSRSGL